MKKVSLFALVGIGMLMTACQAPSLPIEEETNQSSSEIFQETDNVLYRGLLEEAGVSIYMQGTHRLVLDDGRFILLESNTVSLDDYLGERLEVLGSIRPTIEAGGQIMRVQSVRNMNASSETTTSSVSSLSSSTAAKSAAADEAGSAPVIDEQPASTPIQEQASSVPPFEASDELTEKAETMAKVDLDSEMWTQEYCSSHWKFCIPIHKNWWYKSFGATASTLWHVEIGPLEMNNIGEGPLNVNLVNGTTGSDGSVVVSGDTATGYRTWEDGRHFEVRAPASLEEAVRIITEGIKPSAE